MRCLIPSSAKYPFDSATITGANSPLRSQPSWVATSNVWVGFEAGADCAAAGAGWAAAAGDGDAAGDAAGEATAAGDAAAAGDPAAAGDAAGAAGFGASAGLAGAAVGAGAGADEQAADSVPRAASMVTTNRRRLMS